MREQNPVQPMELARDPAQKIDPVLVLTEVRCPVVETELDWSSGSLMPRTLSTCSDRLSVQRGRRVADCNTQSTWCTAPADSSGVPAAGSGSSLAVDYCSTIVVARRYYNGGRC